MDLKEFEYIVEVCKESGMKVAVYPKSYQINMTDIDGVVQTYYASKNKGLFRDGNDWKKSSKHTEENLSVDRFIALCKGEEDILETFFD